ncbi:translation initiation factor IF-3, partial [Candidatus Uhrbacteria bacterium CG11_big_fil_rev_8_21_14_0_20_41_9]
MRIHRHRNRKPKFDIPQFRVNKKITSPEVRVVLDGENRVLKTEEAIALAEEQGLDLIEVSPKANPPVCKIMDFGSFKYQKEKESKKQRATAKEI